MTVTQFASFQDESSPLEALDAVYTKEPTKKSRGVSTGCSVEFGSWVVIQSTRSSFRLWETLQYGNSCLGWADSDQITNPHESVISDKAQNFGRTLRCIRRRSQDGLAPDIAPSIFFYRISLLPAARLLLHLQKR